MFFASHQTNFHDPSGVLNGRSLIELLTLGVFCTTEWLTYTQGSLDTIPNLAAGTICHMSCMAILTCYCMKVRGQVFVFQTIDSIVFQNSCFEM